jgi:hypothetical protein
MPFVNEYMSEAEIEKYCILEINRQFIRMDYKPHWTRDTQLRTDESVTGARRPV